MMSRRLASLKIKKTSNWRQGSPIRSGLDFRSSFPSDANVSAVLSAGLVRSASSGEVLLLAAAALAHLSYVETSAVWPLLTAGSASALLQAVRAQGPRCSVFLQEQAATLLANMSAVPEARAELAEDRAVVALVCFLQLRPSPLQRSADIAAAERVQHKAAIALSRYVWGA